MKTPLLLLSLFAGWLAPTLLAAATSKADSAEKPNIVFILADDLGWRDLACYGSPWHATPNLDRLAREGMRFTTAYASAPICSASRASLLTGRSPARLGFEFVTKKAGTKLPPGHLLKSPPYPLDLPLTEVTLGEIMDGAGYKTGFYGKWHVSQHNGVYLGWSATHGPLQQGFEEGDQEFGSHPYGDATRSPDEMKPFAEGDYGRDALTDKAVAFIGRHRAEPFFLYLSHYYVHEPVRSRASWLEKKYRSILPPDAPLDRAVYAGMVETLDHLVGEVLQALDKLGLTENTLLVFMSDNGGNPKYAANGPLRGSKWNVYEGGLRVPLIVRWPGKVKPGSTCDRPVIGSDLLPTLGEIAGAKPPSGVELDGVSILPLFQGAQKVKRSQPLVWHFPYYHPETEFDEAKPTIGVNDFRISQTRPQSAIRVGDYTLVHFYETNQDELYYLPDDLSEQTDVSSKEPERAASMRRDLDGYLAKVNARMAVAR